jgi:hypothetical protein
MVTSLVSGTACPTLQFVVGGVTVKTSAATSFEDGTCADIIVGTKVEAKGARQTDGSVLASRIEIKDRANGEVEGEGLVTSIASGTACPTLQFVVQGVTVKTTAATSFESGTCADVTVGTNIRARGTRQADGSLLASRVQIKDRVLGDVEGEGRVTSLVSGSACPTLQFVVQGITVKTTAATLFAGGTCADIIVGAQIEAKGARQADGSVIASRVEISNHVNEIEGEGVVTSLVSGTACPTLQFVAAGITVKTSAATSFEGGTCADINIGMKIEAKGGMQADGSLVASRIQIKERAGDVEGEGRVTSLVTGTACPTLQFMAEGIMVKTTAATSFQDGSCADINVGTKIEAKGARQADGSVLASRIQIKERGDDIEGEGQVTSLVTGTACPTLQFMAEGIMVKTTAATSFQDGTCADINVGRKIEAKGARQTDGSVIASRIQIKR